MPLLKYTL
jgi:hypothetical protein